MTFYINGISPSSGPLRGNSSVLVYGNFPPSTSNTFELNINANPISIDSVDPNYGEYVVTGNTSSSNTKGSFGVSGSCYYYTGENWEILENSRYENIQWNVFSCSNSGQYIYTTTDWSNNSDITYYSSDYGNTWSVLTSDKKVTCCSSDGSVLYAYNTVNSYDIIVYKSTDYGSSWNQIKQYTTSQSFYSPIIFCSGDGNVVIFVYYSYGYWYSSDGGNLWTQHQEGWYFNNLTLNYDGSIIYAIPPINSYGFYPLISTDYGANWTQLTDLGYISGSGSVSSDGNHAVIFGGNNLKITHDSGNTWGEKVSSINGANNGSVLSVGISDDGQVILCANSSAYTQTSKDGGNTWISGDFVNGGGGFTKCIVNSSGTILYGVGPSGSGGLVAVSKEGLVSNTYPDSYYYGLRLDSLDYSTGTTEGGENITLSGAGFSDTSFVFFEGRSAQITDYAAYYISVITPIGDPGFANVSVIDYSDQANLTNGFEYIRPFSILSITPNTGPVTGNTSVNIVGGGFDSNTFFYIDNNLLTSVNNISVLEITGNTPSGTLGSKETKAVKLPEWYNTDINRDSLTIYDIASSQDGKYFVAVSDSYWSSNNVFLSKDFGETWSKISVFDKTFSTCDISSDGNTIIVAGDGEVSYCISRDGGETWVEKYINGDGGEPLDNYDSSNTYVSINNVAISSNSSDILVAAYGWYNRIYYSNDLANTWQYYELDRQDSLYLFDCSISNNGSTMLITNSPGQFGQNVQNIFISRDRGVSWEAKGRTNTNNYYRTAMSSNGQIMIVSDFNYPSCISTDFGNTWNDLTFSELSTEALGVSGDGSVLNLSVYGGKMYKSTDLGVSWQEETNPTEFWTGHIPMNYDGSIRAATSTYNIYMFKERIAILPNSYTYVGMVQNFIRSQIFLLM